MNTILWITLTLFTFELIKFLLKKYNIKFLNSILVTILTIIFILVITKTDYSHYKVSTNLITKMLNLIVVMLAIPLYKNREDLKLNFIPIVAGVFTSIIVSITSVILFSKILDIDKTIMLSMFPKSITTPMAIEITKLLHSSIGLTIIFVILTGVIGASLATFTLNLFKVKHPISKGIGIGASSHGIGTSKAVEIHDEVAAASGLAMAISGVFTVLSFSILLKFI